ncbi:hypothetical protein FRB90_009958, partial [Tulasnella sp. 427]
NDAEAGAAAPVLGIGALRTDAEHFPGWRRTVASRLQETDGRSQTTVDINERRSSSVNASHSLAGHVITPMDQIHPNLVTRPPSSRFAILPLPLPNSPDLTRECTKAFSKVGRSRASVSSKSSSSLGGGDKSPKSAPLGTSSLAFLHEQRSEEDGSGTAEHHYYAIGPSSGAPGLLPAEGSTQKVNDLASQSSHSSSQYYPTSAATHPPPMSYQQFYHPTSNTTTPPPGQARTPSPTQHRRNSASSQTALNGLGVASPSSWHGHTSTPTRAGHASWHGPSLATHWPGHLPHFGGARPTDPSSSGSSNAPLPPSASGPPSSWLGHFHPSHHHARSFSGSGSGSSQRPLLSAQSSASPPLPPPSPAHPKFYFQPPSAAGSRAPSPPPSPPPSPLEAPLTTGRRLTVTNPDLNSSPATSSVNLAPATPDEEKPSGLGGSLAKSPLSRSQP